VKTASRTKAATKKPRHLVKRTRVSARVRPNRKVARSSRAT
jgi:hypothetical protein